jgi:hypothetical protein
VGHVEDAVRRAGPEVSLRQPHLAPHALDVQVGPLQAPAGAQSAKARSGGHVLCESLPIQVTAHETRDWSSKLLNA